MAGIESAEQAARLLEIGCLLGQGYRYFRPVDGDTIAELLRASTGTAAKRSILSGSNRYTT
ncbi:hypothetical protein [Hoeflea halophila]|uniref:hypothetical protein n=1 Tax=Hoeflea halophila TaxID=714899 RepID=UPI000BE33B22|nr:hypothetical protein [Hoeflea halophila]